jgi:predicted ATPase
VESGLLIERDGGYELTQPIADLAIPPTLHDSLMARLDRLSAAKEVAQRAAALGREFPYALLQAVAELDEPTLRNGLERLVDAELLFQSGTPPQATYTFKHALIQDAAYGSLLKRTRLRLHARIAEVLVKGFESHNAAPEVVARHYEAAGLADEAATYYERAGARAAARSAHEEAIVHLRKGIDQLALLVASQERNVREARMQVALGSSTMPVRGYAHAEMQAAYDRARILCESTGDAVQLGYALLGLSIFHSNRGELEAGAAFAERVLRLAQQTGDEAHRIIGHAQAAIPKLYQGKFTEALDHCERAISLYDPTRHRGIAFLSGTDQGVAAIGLDAWSLWHLGYPERAASRTRQGIELARKLEHPFSLAYALFFDIGVHNWSRETDLLHAPVEEVIALGHANGFPLWRGLGMTVRGWVRAWCQGDASAIDEMLEGITLAGSTGLQGGIPAVIALLGSAYQAVGLYADALQTVESAFALATQTDQSYWDAELHRMKGELLLEEINSPESTTASERVANAETWLRRAIDIARAQGGRSFELRSSVSLAKLLRTRGQAAEARDLLRPIYARFTEGLRTPDLREAGALLAELS